mgnify:CR=1 FL=1
MSTRSTTVALRLVKEHFSLSTTSEEAVRSVGLVQAEHRLDRNALLCSLCLSFLLARLLAALQVLPSPMCLVESL